MLQLQKLHIPLEVFIEDNKVDFGASDFEAAVLLQIEVKQKMLGRSVTFGVKSVEKHPQTKNFF